MSWLMTAVASNVLVAFVMGVSILLVSRWWRNPFVLHALWILLLVKLVTPPLVSVPCLPNFDEIEFASRPFASRDPTVVINAKSDSEPAEPNSFLTRLWLRLNGVSAPDLNGANQPTEPGTHPEFAGSLNKNSSASSLWNGSPLAMIQSILLTIWFVGFVISIKKTVGRWRRMKSTIQMASVDIPVSDRFKLCIDRVSQKMKLARAPEVIVVDAVLPPMVRPGRHGPTLIVPREFLATLSEKQFEALIAHELAHIQFYHDWFRRFEALVMSIYWWFPPLRLVLRRLRQHEEEICDARVVQLLPKHAKQYAHLLVDTSAYLAKAEQPTSSLVLGMSNFHFLERRVSSIMNNQIQMKFSMIGWIVLLGVVVGLPLSPVGWSKDRSAIESNDANRLAEAKRQEDEDAANEVRASGAKDFADSALKGEVFMLARQLGLEREVVEEIRTSLEPDLNLAVQRGLSKKYAPIGFFRHVDPELEAAILAKTREHLSAEQQGKLTAYIAELEKRNGLIVKLSQQTICSFLDQNLGLSVDQYVEVRTLVSDSWEPSWRGVIFTGADYPLAAEGATTILRQETMKSILNAEQFQAFVNLDSYVFNARDLVPIGGVNADDQDKQLKQLELTCDRIMKLKIEELNSECVLSSTQRDKFTIAAKGAVANLMASFREILGHKDGKDDVMEDPKYFSLIVEPLIVQCLTRDVWKQAVENTLSSEQKTKLDEKETLRYRREKERLCNYTMLYFNNSRMFSFETQVAAAEMLMEKVVYSREGDAMYNLLGGASKIPEKDWRNVIPDENWQSFQMVLQELKRMTPDSQVGDDE